MKVKFENVGRGKHTWEEELKELEFEPLIAAINRRGGLMSNDISFHVEEDEKSGQVFVGGFRQVGTFKVLEEPEIGN